MKRNFDIELLQIDFRTTGNRLKDLPIDSIKEIMVLYYDGKKIKDILSNFGFENMGRIYVNFPKVSKRECEMCGELFWASMKSRQSQSIFEESLECRNCEHIEGFYECNCENGKCV